MNTRAVAAPAEVTNGTTTGTVFKTKEEMKMIPRRILVADDDASIRRLLSLSLGLRGFRVIEARNGREALTAMRGGKADLLLLDLMMPEVSGWDVLRERADAPSLQRIPVIVISAANDQQVASELLNAQIDAILPKPFDLNELAANVTACLERANATAPAAA